MYTCVYVYIYIYTHTYVHTYIHIITCPSPNIWYRINVNDCVVVSSDVDVKLLRYSNMLIQHHSSASCHGKCSCVVLMSHGTK